MAVSSPLMEESIEGATGMLLNFTGSEDLNLFEVNEAADIVVSTADKGANIIFGTVIDPSMGDEVRVTVIATGFEGFETLARAADPGSRPRRAGAASAGSTTASAASCRSPTTTIDVPPFLQRQLRPTVRLAWRCGHRARCGEPPCTRRTSRRGREAGPVRRLGDAGASTRASGPSTSRCARRAASSTSPTWARSRPRGPERRALLQRLLSNDVAKLEVGRRAVLAPLPRGRRRPRRPVHLPARRRPLPDGHQRRQPRARPRLVRASTPPTSTPRSPTRSTDYAMLAVQGPEARAIVARARRGRAAAAHAHRDGSTRRRRPEALVCGTGYTGEDGVELLLAPAAGRALWDALLGGRRRRPAGLGARDTLRLEVCFHLYGNDLDERPQPDRGGPRLVLREETGFIGSEAVAAARERRHAEQRWRRSCSPGPASRARATRSSPAARRWAW